MAFGALSLKGRALRYLSQREHSRVELERKLARFADDQDEATAAEQIKRVLDELVAQGWLSEARVAESVLASQARRFGQHRLKQTLQAKGLDASLVSATLQQVQATEFDRAREVWQRRFGEPAADAAGRAKQARFLASRGFDGDVIRRLILGTRTRD